MAKGNRTNPNRTPSPDNLLERFEKLDEAGKAKVRAVLGLPQSYGTTAAMVAPAAVAAAPIATAPKAAVKAPQAPQIAVPAGFVLVRADSVGRRGRREKKPRNGVQIVPEVDAQGNIMVTPGERFNSICFLTVDAQGNGSPAVEGLYALIARKAKDAFGKYDYVIKRNGWSPSKYFRGNPSCPNLSNNQGRFYLPDDLFIELVKEWNQQVPQVYVSLSDE